MTFPINNLILGGRTAGGNRLVVIIVILLACIFPVELFSAAPQEPAGVEEQYSGMQGQIIVVKIPTDDAVTEVQGSFLGRTVGFFPDTRPGEPKGFVGLVGVDMQDKPGTHELAVKIKNGERSRTLSYNIFVAKKTFRVERLKLPKDKVDLDAKSIARWRAEQRHVREALARNSEVRLWQPGFVKPVNGRRTGSFGSVRIMNGQARNPHSGEDIGAPLGTDVAATNDGVVRLTVDHIFSGKGVYLDHGLGFYSMYFHLSEIFVKNGDLVKAGQIIGKVGATGRATGPHLHWGVKLNGARINPFALLELPFKKDSLSTTSMSIPSGDATTSTMSEVHNGKE